MRRPFHEPGKRNGFLFLMGALALGAIGLLAVGPSPLQARLAVGGIGVLLMGYGVFTPSLFRDQAETSVARTLLGPTITRILIVTVGMAVIAWGFLMPLAE